MAGLMFILHGTNKMFVWPSGKAPVQMLSRGWFAAVIEIIGGGMITIGLFAGFAAFIASGLMAFAYFLVHSKDGFFPIVNKGELAVLYCFMFLYIATRGSGIWSVDSLIRQGRTAPAS